MIKTHVNIVLKTLADMRADLAEWAVPRAAIHRAPALRHVPLARRGSNPLAHASQGL